MNNWMEKFEKSKDEIRETELNTKLEKLLTLLDEAYDSKDRMKVIEKIIDVYNELKIDACDYDEKDFVAKKKELAEFRYTIMKKNYMEEKESESWNEYKKEELEEEEQER